MFQLRTTKSVRQIVKGLFSSPILYEDRLDTHKWSEYFGHYQNQKWGQWDSNSCWCLSAVNCVEDQLEWLWKNDKFSIEAKQFFMSNGYIDLDGDFSLSERFIEVSGGYKSNGANQMRAWELFIQYGMIPRDMLTYTVEQSNKFGTRAAFDADYFNPTVVTTQMLTLGQQFLKYVKIEKQWIGKNWVTPDKDYLIAALKQAPLQIGIPIPQVVWNWNSPIVKYYGGLNAEHAVELYDIDQNNNYLIFDQYQPNLKVLSNDYYLPFVTQGVVSAVTQIISIPVKQSYWDSFWTWMYASFNRGVGSLGYWYKNA